MKPLARRTDPKDRRNEFSSSTLVKIVRRSDRIAALRQLGALAENGIRHMRDHVEYRLGVICVEPGDQGTSWQRCIADELNAVQYAIARSADARFVFLSDLVCVPCN